MISEFWTFGLQNLFFRTREPFFSNLRTFGLKNLRTHEPSNLRTFGLMGCNRFVQMQLEMLTEVCETLKCINHVHSICWIQQRIWWYGCKLSTDISAVMCDKVIIIKYIELLCSTVSLLAQSASHKKKKGND